MLDIKGLTKCYGEKRAVDDLSLHIAPGTIYGFIGHNGAGKTTTLKSVVGILDFDEGEIRINGVSVMDDPIACKKVLAYIPDNPDLYEYGQNVHQRPSRHIRRTPRPQKGAHRQVRRPV